MPLVRCEVRCEHSLADAELFRSAGRDDPEGLLRGVAMAGLVGIVRQLGDLAEFAAEIFRDLHEELTSVGGRAHDLTVRVQQLEAELPAVEKALLSEPNQLRFAYTNGSNWHASIRSDQNHCSSGELPRFVRNFYEECRGPPRLFLLDKFDVAGAGTCIKRYSDPSFFKLEWARSELMKAQRAQDDKKARRDKKKGRRRKTGYPVAAINQIPARVRYGSASLEDLNSGSHLLAPTLKNEVGSSSSNRGANHGHATQTQRRSNLGPQNKVVEGPLPPSGVSAPRAEGGASKSINTSAKDIEANVSESMASRISKIIEMEDREAVPPVGLIPRNVGHKSPKTAGGLRRSDSKVEAKGTKRVTTREDLEVAAMGRTGITSRGTLRSNASIDGKEGSNVPDNLRVFQSSMPADISSRGNTSLASTDGVHTCESRPSCRRIPDDMGVPLSQVISSTDVWDPVQVSGNVLRRSSVDAHPIAAGSSTQNSESSTRGGNDLGNGTAVSTSEDLSGVNDLTQHVAGTSEAVDGNEDSHHSPTFALNGNRSLPHHNNLANMPDFGHGVDEQRKHSEAETPARDGGAPDVSEELVLSASVGERAFHDVHLAEVQRRPNNADEVSNGLEETVYTSPRLPPIQIKEVFANEEESHMLSATSPKIPSKWSSPGEESDLRPSVSMLSRLSDSSELMPLSSGSEPESPVSPNSPTFSALYSPPGSPSTILGFRRESPRGLQVGSYLQTAHRSSYSSPRSEIPVLSLSPRSRLVSPSPVPWADHGDGAGPSRLPPPLPENSSHLESRQDVSSVEPQLYPSTSTQELELPSSSGAVGLPSQSLDGLRRLQENAETVHAESASQRSETPDPLNTGGHFEAPSGHTEQMRPYLEAQVRLPSTTSTSLTEPSRSSSTSPFHLTDSATTQPSHKSSDNLDPQHSTESVGVPSDGPTPNIDLLNSPVRDPSQGPTTNPAPSEVSVHPTPTSLKQAINNVPPSFSVRDEETVPSSPTGSVIIKDTPSPPASPASNHSGSGSEIHKYHDP